MANFDLGLTPIDETQPPTGSPLSPPPPSTFPLPPDLTPLPETGAVTGPKAPEVYGPPFPTAPYNTFDLYKNAYSLGLGDHERALIIAGKRYLTGVTPEFDYPQAYAEVKAGQQAYESANPVTSLAANVTGTLASPTNLLMGPLLKGASFLPKLAGSTVAGGVTGGVSGALNAPSTSLDDILQSAKTGAELGAGVGAAFPVAGAVGSAIFPELTPAARTLRTVGIQPTPGTAVGGLPGTVENLFSQIPIVGAPIGAARTAAKEQLPTAVKTQLETFNRAAVNEPLAIVGEKLGDDTAAGHSAVAEMRTKLKDAYNQAVPTAGGALDAQASSMLNDSIANAKLLPNPSDAAQFEKFVQTNVLGRVQGTTEADAVSAANAATKARQLAEADLAAAKTNTMQTPGPGSDVNLANATQRSQQAIVAETQAQQQLQNVRMGGKPFGTLSGQDFQDADELLGNEAHKYLKSSNARDNDLGQAYLDLQGNLRAWLERVSPENATDLQNANLAWRTAKPVLSAARATRDPNGLFSEDQLQAGARANSTIPQFATGQAPMQQFANAAIKQRDDLIAAGKTLRAPEGGHTGGLLAGGALAGALFERPEMLMHPAFLGGVAAGYPAMRMLYSEPGRRAITGLLSAVGSVPPAIGALGPAAAQLVPQYAPVAGGYASGLLTNP